MIDYWIDIPNLQTVDLPRYGDCYSFQFAFSKSITSICMNINEWIDVSPILAALLPFTPYDIESLDSNTISLRIPNYSFNIDNYFAFAFSRFSLLEELIIGDDCYEYVNEFMIDGLNHLKSIKIGINSFTHIKRDNWDWAQANDPSRSFHVLNCNELKSIEIGRYSFSDYGGKFELRNLPKLSIIKIGEVGRDSSNFYSSSFVVKGIIDIILLMNRPSTIELHWIRWLFIPWILINNNIKYLNDLNE